MDQLLADGLRDDIDIIEDTYEFMLAYAAQGLAGDAAGGTSAQMRDALRRCQDALERVPAPLAHVD
jgi:hypothetical protein